MPRVLLTGGSGFIAAHVVDILLQHGFDIVFTVRSDEKGQKILGNHPGVSTNKLSYVIVKDVAEDGAFDQAVQGNPPFDYVLHTASPFHHNVQDPVKDFLDPAIKGTTGILKAIKAHAPTVKRVVITSSFASIVNAKQHAQSYSEKDWNPVTWEEALDSSATYRGSKTFAEKAAWEFVEKEKPNFDIATICPPLVIGPIVHYLNTLDAINTSNRRSKDFVQGNIKNEKPSADSYLYVDVRDVALAHVKAIEVADAGGKRFFVTNGFISDKDIADTIRQTHPQLESKLPSPDPSSKTLPAKYSYDNTRSRELLGIQYLPWNKTVSDTVDSLLAAGA